MASSSNSPCAACKFLRRKCTQGCVFAPYFPADHPQKFACVHKVFGASNVAKILNELNPINREDAVNSLAYEAEARLRDPIYGCVGYISLLQAKLKSLQVQVYESKKELSAYIGHAALGSFIAQSTPNQLVNPHLAQVYQHPAFQASFQTGVPSSSMAHYGMSSSGIGLQASATPQQTQLLMREQQLQQLQFLEAQQFAAVAAREQELLRSYDQQHDFMRYGAADRFESGEGGVGVVAGNSSISAVPSAEPSAGLTLVPQQQFENSFQLQQPLQEAEQQRQPFYQDLQRTESNQEAEQQQSFYQHIQRAERDQDSAQLQLLQPMQYHQLQRRAESDEARSKGDVVGPSS